MADEVTLSARNRIAIPREARKALGLKPGDKLILFVRDNSLIGFRKPESYRDALRGLGRGVYPPGYLEHERQSWD